MRFLGTLKFEELCSRTFLSVFDDRKLPCPLPPETLVISINLPSSYKAAYTQEVYLQNLMCLYLIILFKCESSPVDHSLEHLVH